MKNSFDGTYEFDYEEENNRFRGMPPHLLALFMEDEKNRENKVALDTTGADKYFIDAFITGRMSYDFWIIAKDFMQHH